MKEVIVDGLRYGKVSSIKLQGQNIIITTKLNNHEQFSKCSFVWPFLALTAFIMWDLWHDTFTWKTALASGWCPTTSGKAPPWTPSRSPKFCSPDSLSWHFTHKYHLSCSKVGMETEKVLQRADRYSWWSRSAQWESGLWKLYRRSGKFLGGRLGSLYFFLNTNHLRNTFVLLCKG